MREFIKGSLDTILKAKLVDDLDDETKWPRGKDLLIYDFQNLGLYRDAGNIDAERKDTWARQLDDHMNRLEQILRPYVAYED